MDDLVKELTLFIRLVRKLVIAFIWLFALSFVFFLLTVQV